MRIIAYTALGNSDTRVFNTPHAPDSKCAIWQKEEGWVSSFLMYKNKTKIKMFKYLMFCFHVLKSTWQSSVLLSSLERWKMKEKKLELLNIIYVCVCVKLSLGQGKIKTYAHTHLSERDLNQNAHLFFSFFLSAGINDFLLFFFF